MGAGHLVAERAGHSQPDYLIRVCLRFWQATDPPIVEKDRTFYRARAFPVFVCRVHRPSRHIEQRETARAQARGSEHKNGKCFSVHRSFRNAARRAWRELEEFGGE